jgi:hypothetical protein
VSSGTTAQETAIELRQAEALKLRVAGFTFREIGRKLGISNCMAHKDVQAALAEYREETAENVAVERGVQLQRLDAAAKVAINVLNGRLPNADELGEDAGPDELAEALAEAEEIKLKAIDRIVKLEERRAKLLGLDAPTKTEVDAKVSGVASPSEAARLVREKFGEHASKDTASGEAEPVQGSGERGA